MARCNFLSLCVCVWITAVILSISVDVSLGGQALDCCLKVSPYYIPKHIVSCYREQRRGDGCSIDAVIFRTRKGRDLCAPYEAKWVKDLMKAVDTRAMKKSKNNLCQSMNA
ncbi:C-C motif chemokine 19a.1 [Neoarius graeffei]|uniref:C-C motif chemokine 19a.1 n=1 Tax=Neoarius graeffei TaxID=443677 RepID=UPI00298CFE45|nr:C-C motif chemokine 19a.1 [Neoarius graeffei]